MDIAALSMDLSASKLVQNVNLSVMKKSMDMEELAAETMMDMLPPPSNYLIDTYA